MSFLTAMPRFAMAALFCILSLPAAHAQRDPGWGADVKGGQDHPLLKRLDGSWLAGYKQNEFEEGRWPGGAELDKAKQLVSIGQAEGRVTRLAYIAPRGKSPLEVFRSHQQALLAAGAKPLFACERQCEDLYWAWSKQLKGDDGLLWADGYLVTPTGSRYSVSRPLVAKDVRFWVGQLPRAGGAPAQVLLVTSVAKFDVTGFAATMVQLVEPQAMKEGQVVVDAGAVGKGLQAEGKVAFYGIYFDTGRAELKPESKAQLDEMAAALKQQPGLRVYIVGHTDNVGAFDANQSLSLARAQAVVQALAAAPHGIKADRMAAKGVASLSPVASNAGDEGRAKNRRVEMVLQ